jgi:hypothetical protein
MWHRRMCPPLAYEKSCRILSARAYFSYNLMTSDTFDDELDHIVEGLLELRSNPYSVFAWAKMYSSVASQAKVAVDAKSAVLQEGARTIGTLLTRLGKLCVVAFSHVSIQISATPGATIRAPYCKRSSIASTLSILLACNSAGIFIIPHTMSMERCVLLFDIGLL